MTGQQKNNVFVMTLLHGGRRGSFLAKKMHFWSNICIFGPKSVFLHIPKRDDLFLPDPVVISKYQNLPMYLFQKCF